MELKNLTLNQLKRERPDLYREAIEPLKQIAKLMREARIPDKVKYTADGKIKPHFLNLLERCEKEEEMKALLAHWESTYRQGPEVVSIKEISYQPIEIYHDVLEAFAGMASEGKESGYQQIVESQANYDAVMRAFK